MPELEVGPVAGGGDGRGDFGQCTWFVYQHAPWLPPWLGDAGDWLANAQAAGLQTGDVPARGAVVVYGRGNGYSAFGHVALVTATHPDGTITVREMNFTGWDQEDYRTSSLYDVIGFIYPPGGSTGPEGDGGGPPTSAGSVSIEDAWAMLQNSLNFTVPTNTGWMGNAADQLRDLRGG